MRKTIICGGGMFAASVVIAVLLLFLGACLPQHPIDIHVQESSEIMRKEGMYFRTVDMTLAGQLDNYTDALILAESKATTISNPISIFTNPVYSLSGGAGPVEDLYLYAYADNPVITGAYTRYWMGFRSLVRLALCFLNYYQIKRYLAALFFALFSAVVCSIAKNVNAKAAFLFAASVILVRPNVVAISFQFSCCFFIAFLALLLIPWLLRHPKFEAVFFLEIGIITMYFDFYTTPVITLGLPLTYLYLLHHKNGKHLSVKRIGADTTSWFVGYGGMWFAKMVLTTVFTDVNGFENALFSFASRVGINKDPNFEAFYSPSYAFSKVKGVLYSDETGRTIFLTAVILIAVVLLTVSMWKRVRISNYAAHIGLLVLAAFPILWFAAAAQPTSIHAWFQYRSVVVLFWASAAFFLSAFTDADLARKQ